MILRFERAQTLESEPAHFGYLAENAQTGAIAIQSGTGPPPKMG